MIKELITVVLLLLLGSLPLVRLPSRMRYLAVLLIAPATAFAIFSAAPFSATSATRSVAEKVVTNRPIEVRDRGFVSSNSCRSCHPSEYASWHESYHRTMTQVASVDSVVGDFDDVTLELFNRKYRLFKRDRKFWIAIQNEDDAQQFEEREVVMTTGSHHMQFYWYATDNDRELGKVPFVFLFAENRWVPADSTFLSPPQQIGSLALGQWNQNCVNCHATAGQPRLKFQGGRRREDLQLVDTHVAEFGIACESCHGPCGEHVRKHGNPTRRYAAHFGLVSDGTVVHPKKLDMKVTSQVCGQCHGISVPKDEMENQRVFWEGYEFRAGDDFEQPDAERLLVRADLSHPTLDEYLSRDPTYLRSRFWSDGMVRVAGREYNGLVNSPCFQHQDESKGVMQCMSCHEMHPHDARPLRTWADDQLKPQMDGDQACLQCHEEYRDRNVLVEHTHHRPSSDGSRCYNCHMPHTTYGLLKGIRSHTVSKPSISESVFVGRPNACNLCHLDKTLQWTKEKLDQWYGIDSPALTKDQASVAASVFWTLQGDAGQRALVAWHMGWAPAIEVSKSDWTPPYLALLMMDDYDAVRYIAYHALKKQPRFRDFRYDYMGTQDRRNAISRVKKIWSQSKKSTWAKGDQLLIGENGALVRSTFTRLLAHRDNRPVLLNE